MVIGSNLWSWQAAQPVLSPRNVAPNASTRSRVWFTKTSSGIVPPSLVVRLHRMNPVATSWSIVRAGRRSPANCSRTKASKRWLELKERTT